MAKIGDVFTKDGQPLELLWRDQTGTLRTVLVYLASGGLLAVSEMPAPPQPVALGAAEGELEADEAVAETERVSREARAPRPKQPVRRA